jgi:hypothetical protein
VYEAHDLGDIRSDASVHERRRRWAADERAGKSRGA